MPETRHQGVSFRILADGSRRYYVHVSGDHVAVKGGERDALAFQAEQKAKKARGQAPLSGAKRTFSEVFELWFPTKRHIRESTREGYRSKPGSVAR